MANPKIEVSYNEALGALVTALSKVQRKGDFCTNGILETFSPRLDIEGVGVVAFPLLEFQAKAIEAVCVQAPYGRGDETIVDTSVRRVWQLEPRQFTLGGSWPKTLETILASCVAGLGLEGVAVRADLYKLLLYSKGGFFKAHRDSEKVDGMFGTLVVALPSFHEGGSLVVRHVGREARLDLQTPDVSTIIYAAFYADCEHEVLPVTQGYRLCLIYNLVQEKTSGAAAVRGAVDPTADATRAAEALRSWAARDDSAPKVAWLLEHQYTPSALSFATLKQRDAAVAEVLVKAAQMAGFLVHLALVRIYEIGAAEPVYSSHRYGRGRSELTVDENARFEIIVETERGATVGQWQTPEGTAADLPEIALGQGELLPPGALDNEKPDEQRLTEATGNEGTTYERAYRRAAIVLWPYSRHIDVLIQARTSAALDWLAMQVDQAFTSGQPGRQTLASLVDAARKVAESWSRFGWEFRADAGSSLRRKMLSALVKLGDPSTAAGFIQNVMAEAYTGPENAELSKALCLLKPDDTCSMLAELVECKILWHPLEILRLLDGIVRKLSRSGAVSVLAQPGDAVVRTLQKLKDTRPSRSFEDESKRGLDRRFVEQCLRVLSNLDKVTSGTVTLEAARALIAAPEWFPPETLIAPAMGAVVSLQGAEEATQILWEGAARYLLARSEHPPEPPSDWSEKTKIRCACASCKELANFARDPARQVWRFKAVQHLRYHVQASIQDSGLDMAFETDTRGSPQSLVCTKTRVRHARALAQHSADVAAFRMLEAAAASLRKRDTTLEERICAAAQRVARHSQIIRFRCRRSAVGWVSPLVRA